MCLSDRQKKFTLLKGLFAPNSWSPISNFRFFETLGKSNGKKWSQMVKLLLIMGLKLPRKKKFAFLQEFIIIWFPCHLSPFTCHQYYLSPITCHQSPVTCPLSPVNFHQPPAIYNLSSDHNWRPRCLEYLRKKISLIFGVSSLTLFRHRSID